MSSSYWKNARIDSRLESSLALANEVVNLKLEGLVMLIEFACPELSFFLCILHFL